MRRCLLTWCSVLLLLLCSAPLLASNLMMVRSTLPFPQAQHRLEEAIRAQGYEISQDQRVDISLSVAGFTADDHRALSYGKPKQIKQLSDRYPELMPFLPPQVVIFSERNSSLLVAVNPLYLKQYFPQQELAEIFEQWSSDLERILEAVRDAPR